MSAKISALPTANTWAELVDYFPVVVGGVNMKIFRGKLLAAAAGEDIAIQSDIGDGAVYVSADGQVEIVIAAGQEYTLKRGTASLVLVSAAGDMTTTMESSCAWSVTANGSSFKIDSYGKVQIIANVMQPVEIDYKPWYGGANWAFSPLFDKDAIDRLAAAVAGLLGTPVP